MEFRNKLLRAGIVRITSYAQEALAAASGACGPAIGNITGMAATCRAPGYALTSALFNQRDLVPPIVVRDVIHERPH